jgi:DNA helicase-2/ATP-dependent DNA helicase PcrA
VVRSAWGAPSHNPASRFLDELPVDLVEWRRTESAQTSWSRPVAPSLARRAGSAVRRFGTAAAKADSAAKAKAARAVPSLAPGDRVSHDSFGLGTVVSLEGAGDNAVASIDFGSGGVKRLLLRYAPVEKL